MDAKARIEELERTVASLVGALETAPHKHMIDFQRYWDWYDGPRVTAVAEAVQVMKPVSK